MCDNCWEGTVVDRGLCADCLTHAFWIEFWDLVGDDGDLIDLDEAMIDVEVEHFRAVLDAQL